jgi:hypothetical protein
VLGVVQAVVTFLAVQFFRGLLERWSKREMAKIATEELLTIPEAGRRLGLTYLQALRTIERGYFTDTVRAGRHRLVPVELLSKLKEAARKAGYE